MNMLTIEDRIAHGLQSYKDHTQLCQYEEYPDWVIDIAQSVNAGNTLPLQGKNYEGWVFGVYEKLIEESKTKN